MKKYILGTFLMSVAMFSSTSCSDFLEQDTLGQETLDSYFYTEEECTKAVTGCYQAVLYDDWWQTARMMQMADMATDDAWCGNSVGDNTAWTTNSNYTGSTVGAILDYFWIYRWQGVLRCNIAIERIPEATNVSTDVQDQLVAEAKFLRAYFYFDLIRNFGGMPIIREMLMPTEATDVTRATVAESYAFVEEDLLAAIEVLPKKSEYSASDAGRATKGAAQTLLAKTYIYQEKWSEAEAVLSSIISSGEYQLMANFTDVWDCSSNNAESIFEDQNISVTEYSLGSRIPVICGSRQDSGWGWLCPTYDLESQYEEGDDRLFGTIIKHGATAIPNETDYVTGNFTDGAYNINASAHKSARICAKFYIPQAHRPSTNYAQNYNPLSFRLLRYADVLLMYAEANYELGNTSTALEYMNMTRTRAGLTAQSGLSGTDLRDAIRQERRLELALESNRLYDIRRWNNDSGSPVICDIMGANGTFYNNYSIMENNPDEYESTNAAEIDKGYYFQSNRDLLFPIPSSEITLSNGAIEQNPNF